MKKIIFTALTIGSSISTVVHSSQRESWDEPSRHSLVGAKAEDVYYFDDNGNLMGHFGQVANKDQEQIRHVAGMDVDTEVPAAKLMNKEGSTEGLAETKGDDGADGEGEEQDLGPRGHTPEEKVAKVAVDTSQKYKRAASKAAKEAATAKSVANRATENAHAYQKQAAEAKEIAGKMAAEGEKFKGQIQGIKAEKNAIIKQAKQALKEKIKELEKQEDQEAQKNAREAAFKKTGKDREPTEAEIKRDTMKKIEKKVQDTLNPPPPPSKADLRAKEAAKKAQEKKEKEERRKKLEMENNENNDDEEEEKEQDAKKKKEESEADEKKESSEPIPPPAEEHINSTSNSTKKHERPKRVMPSTGKPAKDTKPVTVNLKINVANQTNGATVQPAQPTEPAQPVQEPEVVVRNETETIKEPQPQPQPQPQQPNEEEAARAAAEAARAAAEAARQKARADFINSKISVKRSHPEIPITVHLMPYSYTMGQQYQNEQHKDQVHQILNSVFTELVNSKSARTFSFMDVDSFQRWYKSQDDNVRGKMKQLIAEGRFDFAVSAGQASSVETYGVLVESLTSGSKFLREEFGLIPRAAWQVTSDDNSLEAHQAAQEARLRASSTGSLAELSFNQRNSTRSHPSAYARLFSDLGFEGLLIDQPPNDIDLEGNSFLWRASPNHFQGQKQIFTSVISTTDHGYCWPLGFDADAKYNPSNLFNEQAQGSNQTNADDKMISLINHINTLSKFSRGNQILLPFGCDYSFTNAALNFGQMDKLIQYFNANNYNNINIQYSTSSNFIDSVNALRINGTRISYPVIQGNVMPQVLNVSSNNPNETTLGLFDSALLRRATLARQGLRAASTLFSKRMISGNKINADQITAVQNEVRTRVLESLDVLDIDESNERANQQKRLDEAVKQLNKLYQQELKMALSAYTGASGQLSQDLSFCSYSPSEGIQDCPITSPEGRRGKQGTNEIIVVVHNPSMYNQSLVRIKLESQDYKAKIWVRDEQRFEDTDTDIVEQVHVTSGAESGLKSDRAIDYMMFVPFEKAILGGEISFIKLEALNGDKQNSNPRYKSLASETTLEIAGISEQNEVMFHYTNDKYNMSQLFTVNLQTYAANNQSILEPRQFSDLNADVNYQQGSFVDQYTIQFSDPNKKQYGVIKVRFSDLFAEFLEFEVEVQDNSRSSGTQASEFTTIAWKFLDGFELNKKFWVDSNGLEMTPRTQSRSIGDGSSPNFTPVSSALAVRDASSLRQATILNDRPQLATADYQNGTVEFIHLTTYGQAMTSKYWLQIFDRFKGQSKQRDQQILVQTYPLQYFYAFNVEDPKFTMMYTGGPSSLAEAKNDGAKIQKQQLAVMSAKAENGDKESSAQEISYDLYAVDQNEILLRIYNRADRFDDKRAIAAEKLQDKQGQSFSQGSDPSFAVKYLDVQQLANALYFSSINSTKLPAIRISEVDISGIRSVEEVAQSRGQWEEEGKKASGSAPVYPLFTNPADKNGLSGVAVQPQAIRTFVIRYGDAARKALPAPIVHKPHAVIEVAAKKLEPVKPVVVPVKNCVSSKQPPKVAPAPVQPKAPEKVPEKVEEEPKEQAEEAPRNAEPTKITVRVIKSDEEASAKETTPKIWKELKSSSKASPKTNKDKKAKDSDEHKDKKENKSSDEKKSVKSKKGGPDLSPLYKESGKPSQSKASAKQDDKPTKIVVHIKAAEQEDEEEQKPKEKSKSKQAPKKASKKQSSDSATSLFEKLNIKPSSSISSFSTRTLSSTIDDDDEQFQGSVVEFENKLADSKFKLSGADKITLPSSDDDDALIQIKKKGRKSNQKSSRYLIGSI